MSDEQQKESGCDGEKASAFHRGVMTTPELATAKIPEISLAAARLSIVITPLRPLGSHPEVMAMETDRALDRDKVEEHQSVWGTFLGLGNVSRRERAVSVAARAGLVATVAALMGSVPVFASTAPGLGIFTSLESWVSQYGIAGLPLAIAFGGLLFAVEHHQQRTGNAIRAKGYIFAAAAGVIVIGLAGTIASAIQAIVPSS